MRRQRATEQPAEAQQLVSFRRVGGIRPIGPDGTIRAYTSRDLRSRLAGLTVALSGARKFAAIIPLVLGLAGWAVIPSYAAAPRNSHTVANQPAPVNAPAPQAPIVSGPISVVPPSQAGAPVTGAGDGIMRSSIVGLCLLVSGLVMLTAPRRNPHAEAEWREAHARAPQPQH